MTFKVGMCVFLSFWKFNLLFNGQFLNRKDLFWKKPRGKLRFFLRSFFKSSFLNIQNAKTFFESFGFNGLGRKETAKRSRKHTNVFPRMAGGPFSLAQKQVWGPGGDLYVKDIYNTTYIMYKKSCSSSRRLTYCTYCKMKRKCFPI